LSKLTKKTQLTTGGPVFVYVDESVDKIIRLTPMDLDDSDADSWELEARGRTFKPPRKTTYSPYTAGFKSMIYLVWGLSSFCRRHTPRLHQH